MRRKGCEAARAGRRDRAACRRRHDCAAVRPTSGPLLLAFLRGGIAVRVAILMAATRRQARMAPTQMVASRQRREGGDRKWGLGEKGAPRCIPEPAGQPTGGPTKKQPARVTGCGEAAGRRVCLLQACGKAPPVLLLFGVECVWSARVCPRRAFARDTARRTSPQTRAAAQGAFAPAPLDKTLSTCNRRHR